MYRNGRLAVWDGVESCRCIELGAGRPRGRRDGRLSSNRLQVVALCEEAEAGLGDHYNPSPPMLSEPAHR